MQLSSMEIEVRTASPLSGVQGVRPLVSRDSAPCTGRAPKMINNKQATLVSITIFTATENRTQNEEKTIVQRSYSFLSFKETQSRYFELF